MDYQSAAKFLRDCHEFDPPAADSTVTRKLLDEVGNPHENVQFVQVTGSNGKGSTVSMTERILRAAGFSVGMFTTPHPLDLRKSVQIDGRPMPREAVAEFVSRVRSRVREFSENDESPAYFEVLTALALWEFDRQDVDVAVIEVGCGGARDPTSVIDPTVAAVTNVSLEHVGLLGETRAEIAREKAAIAPADGPLVTGATGDALAVVEEVADKVVTVGADGGSDADTPDADSLITPDVSVSYEGREGVESRISVAGTGLDFETRVSQLGEYQAQNAGVAVTLARQFAGVGEAECRRGLRTVQWPGRCEVLSRDPLVVLDSAGNADAAENLAELVASFDYDRLHVVFGALAPKPHVEMVGALPTPDLAVTCQPDLGPWEEPEALEATFADAGADATESKPTVADAFDRALSTADPDDLVLVTGSIIVALEARHHWTHATIPKTARTDADLQRRFSTLDEASEQAVREARHRTFRTELQSQQASRLEELLSDLGGTCVVVDEDMVVEQTRDVVLSGTNAQLEALVERVEAESVGLSALAEDLRAALDGGDNKSDDCETENRYPWTDGTAVMGVLDCGFDSDRDGDSDSDPDPDLDGNLSEAIAEAESMVAAGVDIVDVSAYRAGRAGESALAEPISPETERSRVVPVIEKLSDLDVLVSVNTWHGAVASAALDAGADLVVDDSGLADPEMRFVMAENDVPLVLTHSTDATFDSGIPSDSDAPSDSVVEYDDVVADTMAVLRERIVWAEQAGVDREQILVSPGLGLGKARSEDAELVGRLDEYRSFGRPILVTPSRLVDDGTADRRSESVALSTVAVERGADVLRVHDVPSAVDAVAVGRSVSGDEQSGFSEK